MGVSVGKTKEGSVSIVSTFLCVMGVIRGVADGVEEGDGIRDIVIVGVGIAVGFGGEVKRLVTGSVTTVKIVIRLCIIV